MFCQEARKRKDGLGNNMEMIMSRNLTVMTYNVRSCVGKDGKASPSRISAIIGEQSPDVVALQELDVGLVRSGMADQAQNIAKDLNMDFSFSPSLSIEAGEYGNAVLSRFPMRKVRAAELPTHPNRIDLEKRGALWVEIEAYGGKVQIITTHLGLNRRERRVQADELVGEGWLGHPECRFPAILCGDLNSQPGSSVYRKLAGSLIDVQTRKNGLRPRKTWPSRFPLSRIDHVFVTPDVLVEDVTVPRTGLTAVASDHLPLVVTLRLPPRVGKEG